MNSIDKLMHAAYRADVMYKEPLIGVMCRKCGTRLKAYYCEDRLYAVKCDGCESVTLVKAAQKSFIRKRKSLYCVGLMSFQLLML